MKDFEAWVNKEIIPGRTLRSFLSNEELLLARIVWRAALGKTQKQTNEEHTSDSQGETPDVA